MAHIDPETGRAILRIVYDGPPLSGKTETLVALGRELHGSAKAEHRPWSPDQAEGRTLFFDWLEYRGGLFRGRPVYCQLVSVPGQEVLVERRRHIVATADAVVFVVDAATPDPRPTRRAFELLLGWLEAAAPLAVGVVIQANKQDLAPGFSRERLLRGLGDLPQATLVPTTATTGRGVREGFVTAMRLAMDHAAELDRLGRLQSAAPDELSGRRLLDSMGATPVMAEAPPPPAPAASPPRYGSTTEPPRPGADSPGEWLWPAVRARALLHEMADEPLRETRHADGQVRLALGRRWRLLTAEVPVAHTPEQALARLQQVADHHQGLADWSDGHRCLALSRDAGDWYLWQLVRSGVHLDYVIERLFHFDSPHYLVRDLLGTARDLQQLLDGPVGRWMAEPPQATDFALWKGRLRYSGFLRWEAPDTTPPGPSTNLRNLLQAPLHRGAARHAQRIPELLEMLRPAADEEEDAPLVNALRAMLIGE